MSEGLLTTDEALAAVTLRTGPAAIAVLMSPLDEERTARELRLVHTGVRAIVRPEAPATEALDVLRRLRRGEATLGAATVDAIAAESGNRRPRLTDQQIEIVLRLAAGQNTREVAADLCVTPGTVRTHIRHIAQRCDLTTTVRAVTDHAQYILDLAADPMRPRAIAISRGG